MHDPHTSSSPALRLSLRWKMTVLYGVLLGALVFGSCAIIVASARAAVLAVLGPTPERAAVAAILDRQLVTVIVPCMFGALVLVLALGFWLAGRLLRPLAHVTATARRIGGGHDLSLRIGAPVAPDEVGQLAATFDAMLARLEQAFVAQRQFVADASHELKTPLTAILGHANLLRRHGQCDPQLVGEASAAIIGEAERMQRLSQSLLALARADFAPQPPAQPVQLSHLLHVVRAELAPLAAERAVALQLDDEEGELWVQGDHDQLVQVVVNLLDNALAYTSAGGAITLALRRVERDGQVWAALKVADTGCGIPPDELPHIFRRFYRVEKARTRAAGGSGLGLAIVREVVTRHGGTVDVCSSLGEGSTFSVLLPVYSPPKRDVRA